MQYIIIISIVLWLEYLRLGRLFLSPPLINNNNCRHLFVVTVVVVVSAVNTVLASLKSLVDTHTPHDNKVCVPPDDWYYQTYEMIWNGHKQYDQAAGVQ